MAKFCAIGKTRVVRNQFSALEHMSRNQFCIEVSVDTWNSINA